MACFLLTRGNKVSGSNSAVECQLPKLDVAGSIPVSRSLTSTTWKPLFAVLHQNYIINGKLSLQKRIQAGHQPRPAFRAKSPYTRSNSHPAYAPADRQRPWDPLQAHASVRRACGVE